MDQVLNLVRENDLEVAWVLDTHPHADHVMASAHLKDRTGAPNAIRDKVSEIARIWAEIYNLLDAFDPARDFDRLFADGETFAIGDLKVRVMLAPGHNPERRSALASLKTIEVVLRDRLTTIEVC